MREPTAIVTIVNKTAVTDGTVKKSDHPRGSDERSLKKIIWALAFAITTGVALTTAFGFGLIPLGTIY